MSLQVRSAQPSNNRAPQPRHDAPTAPARQPGATHTQRSDFSERIQRGLGLGRRPAPVSGRMGALTSPLLGGPAQARRNAAYQAWTSIAGSFVEAAIVRGPSAMQAPDRVGFDRQSELLGASAEAAMEPLNEPHVDPNAAAALPIATLPTLHRAPTDPPPMPNALPPSIREELVRYAAIVRADQRVGLRVGLADEVLGGGELTISADAEGAISIHVLAHNVASWRHAARDLEQRLLQTGRRVGVINITPAS
ncbi:MAG: hypothetical protein AAGK04_08340 [Planctomycetota bacterium]